MAVIWFPFVFLVFLVRHCSVSVIHKQYAHLKFELQTHWHDILVFTAIGMAAACSTRMEHVVATDTTSTSLLPEILQADALSTGYKALWGYDMQYTVAIRPGGTA